MTVAWRSWALVSAAIGAGLLGLVLLASMQFNTTLTHLVQGRLAVLAQSVALSFRSSAALGLPLASVRNAAAILERARQTDPAIAAILIHDDAGRVVQSTARGGPSQLDAALMGVYRAAPVDAWRAETPDHIISGVRMRHAPASRPAGGVVVIYPKTDIWTATLAMAARMIHVAIAVAIAAAGLVFLLLRLAVRRFDRPALRLGEAVEELERDGWRAGRDTAREPVATEGDAELLVRDARAAIARYRAVSRALAGIDAAGRD